MTVYHVSHDGGLTTLQGAVSGGLYSSGARRRSSSSRRFRQCRRGLTLCRKYLREQIRPTARAITKTDPFRAPVGAMDGGDEGLPHWPLTTRYFDDRFEQGSFFSASEGDDASNWVVEPRDEELLAELKEIEHLDAADRQEVFEQLMDEFEIDGYLLADGRTVHYNAHS